MSDFACFYICERKFNSELNKKNQQNRTYNTGDMIIWKWNVLRCHAWVILLFFAFTLFLLIRKRWKLVFHHFWGQGIQKCNFWN